MRLFGDTCVSFYLFYVAWDDLWKTPQARSREEAAFHFYFWKVLNNILPWLNEKSIKGETSCSSGFNRRPEVLMQVVSIQSSHLKRIKCWFQVHRARKLQKLLISEGKGLQSLFLCPEPATRLLPDSGHRGSADLCSAGHYRLCCLQVSPIKKMSLHSCAPGDPLLCWSRAVCLRSLCLLHFQRSPRCQPAVLLRAEGREVLLGVGIMVH